MNRKYKEKDYSDNLVAFLDILGFKHLILQDKLKSLKSINSIDGHLKQILTVLKDEKENDIIFSTKLFSDCMSVSCKYSYENIFNIIYELAYIQFYFSSEGIFLRGALSRGNHFENSRMIFSQGLVNAFELEQQAIYPRIVIDKKLINQIINDDNSYFPIYVGFKMQDFLIKSPDGQYCIDYLNMVYEEGLDQIESLQMHKKAILSNVQQNYNDISVIEKYRWLAEYHNLKFNEIFTADDWEDNYANEIIKETLIDLKSVFPQFSKNPK